MPILNLLEVVCGAFSGKIPEKISAAIFVRFPDKVREKPLEDFLETSSKVFQKKSNEKLLEITDAFP